MDLRSASNLLVYWLNVWCNLSSIIKAVKLTNSQTFSKYQVAMNLIGMKLLCATLQFKELLFLFQPDAEHPTACNQNRSLWHTKIVPRVHAAGGKSIISVCWSTRTNAPRVPHVCHAREFTRSPAKLGQARPVLFVLDSCKLTHRAERFLGWWFVVSPSRCWRQRGSTDRYWWVSDNTRVGGFTRPCGRQLPTYSFFRLTSSLKDII